jgi:phosphopantothenoylcysteine decarboxylase/phosphopantothenate--cysteine ligase
MARILITSGPTRQYLDPVRYLTNSSSGRMGKALAEAALALGHEVVVVSGPVEIAYPPAARVVAVVSTEEMLAAAAREFDACDGLIGAAAPCDYRPVRVADHKIHKTGDGVDLHLIETDDVVATLGERKGSRWVVGFALETEDHRLRALAKLERKHCNLVVSNGPAAIASPNNSVEILAPDGKVLATFAGPKEEVAAGIVELIHERLVSSATRTTNE